MNRLDRLTAILIQLQSKRVVRAQEIAERFGISLRTVYRDMRSLENSGVPIIGEAGIGYSLADGYRLPPVQFTWCQLRKALRHFRLDRMAQLRRTSRFFEAHSLDLQTHLNDNTPRLSCVIGVENDMLSYIG